MFIFFSFFVEIRSFLFEEHFSDENWTKKWTITKLENYSGEWNLIRKNGPVQENKNYIEMSSKNKFHGISCKFEKPIKFEPNQKEFIIQYEVLPKSSVSCSGAYIKLFGPGDFESNSISNETNYIIMFGPDQCGATDQIHFIMNHWNPILKKYEEKRMTDNPVANLSVDKPMVFTLIIRNNNKFEIRANLKPVRFGNFLYDFDPPFTPPHEIDDPTDVKPSDWVDDEYIVDKDAKKPDDWDETEPQFIPDPEKLNPPKGWLLNEPKEIPNPNSIQPDDWDENMYGEWESELIENPKCLQAPGCGEYEPPLIVNPKYVGPWEPPMYRNILYRGKWRPRKMVNPNYFEDKEPYKFAQLTGVGFDLWTVDGNIYFSNIIISDDLQSLNDYNNRVYSFLLDPKINKQKR